MSKRLWQLMYLILCIGFIPFSYAASQQHPSDAINQSLQANAEAGRPPSSEQTLLVLDAKDIAELPRNFRTTSAPIATRKHYDAKGLKDLQAVGSAQFSASQLKLVVNLLRAPITVVDLRQESHGYVNGNAVSWYGGVDNQANEGKPDKTIEEEQAQLLSQLKQAQTVSINEIVAKSKEGTIEAKPITMKVDTVMSEYDLARQENLGYERFFVTDRSIPTDQEVDRFIAFANTLPKGQWLYFHCRAGEGRTTTFMAMYDILHNGKQVKLDQIVKRQHLLGGINLLKIPVDNRHDYEKNVLRAQFIKSFYQYVVSNTDNFKTSYSEWTKEKGQALNLESKQS